jgi:16S rRNA (adenine1518-N6/adenine1519-N6)-dimethyltransferase
VARQPLGQHFLRDLRFVNLIARAAELHPGLEVLEIGPGKGVLTTELIAKEVQLTAVELDERLAAALVERYKSWDNVRIVRQDILKADLPALFPKASPDQPIRVLGNLPYSITSPIFEKLLAWPGWDVGVFLIQKEVAERIRSKPGSKVYGVLSLAVQLFAETEVLATVKPGAFIPPPRVHSAILRLRRRAVPLAPEHIEDFFDLVHGAFAHRRKTLLNTLSMHAEVPKERVDAWLKERGENPGERAENWSLETFVKHAASWGIFRRESRN